MSEEAIVNASPLILLSRAGHLNLLRSVRSDLLVPEAVIEELRAKGAYDASFVAVTSAAWLRQIPERWLFSMTVPRDALLIRSGSRCSGPRVSS